MTVILTALYTLGAVFSLVFLAVYHPRQWRRVESVNAAGWIIIVAVVFVRALVLIVLHGGVRPTEGTADAVVSVGSLALVDVLVLLRLVSFWRWTRGPGRT